MQVETLSREQDENLRKWQDKTPALAALKGTAKGGKKGGKGKADDKGKGKKK